MNDPTSWKQPQFRAQASQVPEQEPVADGVITASDGYVKWANGKPPIYTKVYLHPAPTEHTAADAPNREAGDANEHVRSEISAVGVPDVAGLVKRLREPFFVYSSGEQDMWPHPNLHEEAATALTALQAKLTDHEREVSIYAVDILQQAATIKEMRELLKQAATSMAHAFVFITTKENMHKTGQELWEQECLAIAAYLERTK